MLLEVSGDVGGRNNAAGATGEPELGRCWACCERAAEQQQAALPSLLIAAEQLQDPIQPPVRHNVRLLAPQSDQRPR